MDTVSPENRRPGRPTWHVRMDAAHLLCHLPPPSSSTQSGGILVHDAVRDDRGLLHGIPDELHPGEDRIEGGNGVDSRQPLDSTVLCPICFDLSQGRGAGEGTAPPTAIHKKEQRSRASAAPFV